MGHTALFRAWFFNRACALYGKESVEVRTQSAPLTDWISVVTLACRCGCDHARWVPVDQVMAKANLTWGPGDCIYGAGLLQIAMTARQEPPRVPQQAQMVRYGGLHGL
jgi:hypothetical protein